MESVPEEVDLELGLAEVPEVLEEEVPEAPEAVPEVPEVVPEVPEKRGMGPPPQGP